MGVFIAVLDSFFAATKYKAVMLVLDVLSSTVVTVDTFSELEPA